MTLNRTTVVQISAWKLSVVVSLVAIVAWGQDNDWQLSPYSNYVIFPLLGLLAFSLMWAHYISNTLRELAGVEYEALSSYFRRTSYAVLVLICLHPGLLIYQLWRDGVGLPPGSFLDYVGPSLGWVALLGTASFFVFLAFEFHRWFRNRSWWKYVANASDFAMLAIAYHGFRLGGQLQQGWFRYVWWFYAATLVLVLIRKYYLKLPTKSE